MEVCLKLPSVKTDYYSTFWWSPLVLIFSHQQLFSKWQIKWYLPMITGCNTAMIKFFSGLPSPSTLPIHLTSSLQLFPWDSLLLADLRKGYAGFFCLTCLSPLDLSWPILPFSWGVCLMMLLRESSPTHSFPLSLIIFPHGIIYVNMNLSAYEIYVSQQKRNSVNAKIVTALSLHLEEMTLVVTFWINEWMALIIKHSSPFLSKIV